MKRILVFREKHAHRYFDASTDELTAKACVKILRERMNDGYWYSREYEKAEKLLSADEKSVMILTDEQLEILPQAMRDQISEKRAIIKRKQKSYLRNKALEDSWFAAAEKLMEGPVEEAAKLTTEGMDGWGRRVQPLAKAVLEARGDGEYEGFEFENLESC